MRARTRAGIFGLGAVLAAFLAAPAFGWGHTGHAMINRFAVDCLPEGPLKVFFGENKEYITEHAIDPDNYKKGHKEEGPKHYLDICTDGIRPDTYPRSWKACVARFGEEAATRQGKLPWA